MSHIATYKSTIGNVNVDLIKKALEVLALEDDLRVSDGKISGVFYYGHRIGKGSKFIGTVSTRESSECLGVVIDENGQLTFVSDSSYATSSKKIRVRIEQTYKLVALITALQNMGYEVSLVEETKKMTILEGILGRKKITAGIDDKGSIATDFDGFLGKSCFEEAQKLAEEIKELGVNVNVENLEPKPESQIESTGKQRQRE